MTHAFPHSPAVWSYGLASLVFLAFAVQFAVGWRGGARASLLLAALCASTLWAAATWLALVMPMDLGWNAASMLDALRLGAWLVFLTSLTQGTRRENAGLRGVATLRMAGVPLLLMMACALMPPAAPWLAARDGDSMVSFYALLGTAVFGLVLAERLFRQTPLNRRWAIKPLVIGMAGMFAFDLLTYSSAILFGQADPAMWAARGIAHAMAATFVAVATARNTAWTVELHVSRDAVYQSTALLMAGVYLLLVAFAGYWVHLFGGDWGGTLRTAFVFAALLFLGALLSSGSLRAWLKVFIGKNLFSYRYDYRTEWLRFTRGLGTAEQGENLYQQAIRALANLVESIGGSLWLLTEGRFLEAARVNVAAEGAVEYADGSLAAFLRKVDWVIQLDEARRSPATHPGLALPAWLAERKEAWLVVPLHPPSGELLGFVILTRPRTPVDVNWEVRDLLKTAGRQAASYIAQVRAQEALVEGQKFDAFNRMSAFVVHDLKNLVAQLALLLKNAERHRGNPEFQRDMLETVEHAVSRMNQLMLQLRTGTQPMEKPRPLELAGVMERILAAKALGPARVLVEAAPALRVLAHEDRAERVIGHIIQNALEASRDAAQPVWVRFATEQAFAIVEIADQGEGMNGEFMRERLFHPFQTTKAQGMGIGMYESLQYVNSIGGRIAVDSEPGRGSCFRVYLPLADADLRTAA